MNLQNVKLIFLRELRDQLRDRRTLFTIAVLPLLLYPLLGMTMLQVQQFLKDRSRIQIVGAEALPEHPSLLLDGEFNTEFCSEDQARLLEVKMADAPAVEGDSADDIKQTLQAMADHEIRDGKYDVVLYFPPDFGQRLDAFRDKLQQLQKDQGDRADQPMHVPAELKANIPGPEIYKNTAIDRSTVAYERLTPILRQWREAIVRENLRQSHLPAAAIHPFELVPHDVAEVSVRRAALWSKILPFILLVWALTGAFYPAVDLCAGEKERGTLETLLSSPAQRSEIVWGKLLTVMSFSMATSLLNLASMGMTGTFIMVQLQKLAPLGNQGFMGPPPAIAIFWLALALVPISALFSALSLAIAAFARSSKEGQYYLMPLLLVSLPLMMIPMLPSSELNVGTSLIPVTGVMLLLRSLIEGQYWDALRYFPLVTGVTGVCCLLAVRWATDQFNNESVLFRESERFSVGLWVRHLVRDRGDTPSVAEALFCGVLLLVIRFFASFSVSMPTSWGDFVTTTVILQVALIATPACLMAIMLTRKPAATLLLRRPSFVATVPAAALLAVLFHPVMLQAAEWIQAIYPISEDTVRALAPIERLISKAPLWQVLLLAALTPAICEELAFRGFILSGLRRMGHKWAAIVLCSVLFGLAHSVLQQSLSACLVGIVIGYIAVKTGSLLPATMYHLFHNGLSIIQSRITAQTLEDLPLLRFFLEPGPEEGAIGYSLPAMLLMAGLGIGLLMWFKRLPYRASDEERLQQALDHQAPAMALPAGQVKRLA